MASPEQARDDVPYQVVARRFRPRHFGEVVGQGAVVQMLSSSLESGRIPHAFLFSGSRGVGKTTLARILARALNCERGPTPAPCDECSACESVLAGSNPDVVEIDAASHNLVDDIRELRDRVGLASMGSRFKVYILDEVHMLTKSAFNAFLKTLEEPPKGVVFIMATTELHKVPETIRSRCQVQLFRRVEEDDITRRPAAICEHEGVSLPDAVLDDVAASSRGGMRDAEGALERILPIAREKGGELDLETYRALVHRVGFDRAVDVAGALLDGDPAEALRFAAEAVDSGADERETLGELLEILRAVLLLAVDGADSPLVPYSGPLRTRLQELAESSGQQKLEAMIQAGLLGRERIRRVEDRRLVLEMALLSMARAGSLPELGELLAAAQAGAPAAVAVPASAPGGAPTPAASVPAAAAGDLHGRLVAHLAEEQPLLGRTIEQCRVSGPDPDGRVQVALQTDSRLHRDRLAASGVQDSLREALAAVTGREVQLVIAERAAARAETEESAAPAKPSVRKPAAKPKSKSKAKSKSKDEGEAAPGPSVQKVVERFDGQIVQNDDLGGS